MAGETIVIETPAEPAGVAAPAAAVPTVQETVEAAVAVAAAVERAAENISSPDEQLVARVSSLETENALLREQVGTLSGRIDAMALTQVAQIVAEEEEEEVTPTSVAETVEVVPPETVPPPEAPSIRAKRKRHFL